MRPVWSGGDVSEEDEVSLGVCCVHLLHCARVNSDSIVGHVEWCICVRCCRGSERVSLWVCNVC